MLDQENFPEGDLDQTSFLQKVNVNVGWWLNRLHMAWITGSIRWLVYRTFAVKEELYGDGYRVHVSVDDNEWQEIDPPYKGWIETLGGVVLAFIKTDGTLQFRW